MLVLHNMRMESSNVRKKKRTTKCDKSIVKCCVDTIKRDNGTIKCEKKIKESSSVIRVQSHVM